MGEPEGASSLEMSSRDLENVFGDIGFGVFHPESGEMESAVGITGMGERFHAIDREIYLPQERERERSRIQNELDKDLNELNKLFEELRRQSNQAPRQPAQASRDRDQS
ncbi:hypothetical protein L596_012054 [Steinernema carpocapsae]|nr:hypothetical protein L596_012054 [Steinernema carpocapsae]